MVKVQRLSQFKMITLWRRRRTLEGSLGRMGMKNPNYGREALGFFSFKKSITDKIFAIRLEELFWARNKVGCSFGFGLWAWPLEASHYGRPSREARPWEFMAKGLDFGLGLWRLHTMGHFTHEIESMWPLHFKHSHWWKRQSRSKFASHYAWGTNGVCECKTDVKSTWTPTWHQMDHVSWSLGIIFKHHLLEGGLTQNRETTALQMLTTVGLFYWSCVRTRMNRNSLK
jgi:hypothetical protein